MQNQGIAQFAIVVFLIALMSGAAGAQCSNRGYYSRQHDRVYSVAPAYREVVVVHAGAYRHGRGDHYSHGHGRRHWGR